MSPIEEELKALLAPLRETQPTPVSTVDVVRAVRTGRRWQRGRVAAGVVAVVALIALPVIMIPTVLHSSPPADPPTELPVDHRIFDVGTAGGYRPDNYTTSETFQSMTLVRTDNGFRDGQVRVTRGHGALGAEAEPVNGHRAYWGPEVANTTLVMEGPYNLWATVSLTGADPELRARAHRVAESITFAGTPVTLPFTLTNPTLKINSYQISPTDRVAMITVSVPGARNAVIKVQPVSEVPSGSNASDDKAFVPNRSINNQPAKVTDGGIILLTPSGFTVEVMSTPGTTEAQLMALLTSVRLVNDPRDPSNWARAPMQ